MEPSELEKDEAAALIQARIFAPLQWDSPPDFIIQDLKDSYFDEAIRLIKHHYFREDPTCKSSFLLQDVKSVQCYLDLIKVWIKDTTSLVALSTRTGRVVGVAVTRINYLSDRTNTYSRVQICVGDALQTIMHLKNTLVKQARSYNELNVDMHLRVYILCVHPTYENKGAATALLDACIQTARTLKMPAITGIFTSSASQSVASKLGFRILTEIRYSHWIVDDQVVFDDPGTGNYSAAYMGMLTPEEEMDEEKLKRKRQMERKKLKRNK